MASLKEILDAREERWIYSRELLSKYGQSLVTISLNIPGENKLSPRYVDGHSLIVEDFTKLLKTRSYKLIHKEVNLTMDGPEAFLIVAGPARDLKILAIEFEDKHPLGRIGDLDVESPEGALSRRDFNIAERSCLLCSNSARTCIVSRNHRLEDLIDMVDNLIDSNI